MSKVIVFGTGSFAQVVQFYLTHDSEHEVVAFTVHEDHISDKELLGLPVVPFETIERDFPATDYKLYVAIGYKNVNRVRAAICAEARAKGYELISYVSSKCTHWGDTIIGDNCFIFEDNTLQPFVRIGNNVVMWSGNHIGHHSTIGDHCFITSHVVISGHVEVGPYCFIGVNATTRDSIRIGEACVIGAGSLIMKSTQDKEVYISKRTYPDKRSSDDINM
ncbi:MAG TPA: acetyltransferase [Pyrinomonadaceae bacterium]|nr:acetyltransferase [Pyrinomonadaceae bacterium]